MNSPSRTAQYGARSRGQTFNYLPEDLTIVGDSEGKFAAWVKERFGKHGPRVISDSGHPLYDPRVLKVFDPEWLAKLEAMAKDILENKVEVPIGVSLGETAKGEPQVLDVYGRRRIVGVCIANATLREQGTKDADELIHLPAVVRRGTMEELRAVMIAENDNRENNPPSVQMENVYRAVVLREQPIARIANRMGRPVAYVERLLTLRECAPEVVAAVDDGTVPVSSVIDELRKLPPEKQVAQIERLKSGGAKTGRAAADKVREENPDHAEPPKAKDAPATPLKPARKRAVLVAEKEALEAKLADPKYDAARRSNQAALEAIRWALGEVDEPPSSWKAGPPTTATLARAS